MSTCRQRLLHREKQLHARRIDAADRAGIQLDIATFLDTVHQQLVILTRLGDGELLRQHDYALLRIGTLLSVCHVLLLWFSVLGNGTLIDHLTLDKPSFIGPAAHRCRVLLMHAACQQRGSHQVQNRHERQAVTDTGMAALRGKTGICPQSAIYLTKRAAKHGAMRVVSGP